MSFAKRVTVLAVAALLALPAAASANPTWLAPEGLSASGQSGEFSDVAMAQDGAAAVSWQRSNGANEIVEVAVRPPFGGFGKAIPLSPSGDSSTFAQVAVDGAGEALVAWTNGTAGAIEVSSVVSGLASVPLKLTAKPGSVALPVVAIAEGGAAVVAWTRGEGSEQLVEASYRPAGGSFGKAQALSSEGKLAEFPRVAIDAAGEATVVWSEHSSGEQKWLMRDSTRAATAASFSANALSSEFEAEREPLPSVAADAAGDTVVGWVQYGASAKAVSLMERSAGGQFAQVQLAEAAASGVVLAVGLDGASGPSVAWEGTDPIAGSIDFASGPRGGPLSATQPVAPIGIFPSLAEDAAGDVLVGEDSFLSTAAAASYRPAGGAFQAPVTVSPAKHTVAIGGPGLETRLNVAIDGQGDGLFGYAVVGTEAIVTQSMLDAAGPLLEDLAIPATGAVDSPIGFTVAPRDQLSTVAGTTWSFGDATTVAGASVTHTFARPGAYSVSVTSTDAFGNSTTQTGKITIAMPPTRDKPLPLKKPKFKGAHLVSHAVRAGGNGALRLRVACPASSGCKGKVTLTLKTKAAGLGLPATAIVGHDSFRAKAGGRASVTFTLSKALLKLLRKRHHLKMTLLIEARDVYGTPATTTGKVKVRAPKRR